MRLVRAQEKCVSRLARGEVRRVPKDPRYLMGIYLGCPSCGLVTVISADERTMAEQHDGSELRLSMRPAWPCERCKRAYRIENDEIVFDE